MLLFYIDTVTNILFIIFCEQTAKKEETPTILGKRRHIGEVRMHCDVLKVVVPKLGDYVLVREDGKLRLFKGGDAL